MSSKTMFVLASCALLVVSGSLVSLAYRYASGEREPLTKLVRSIAALAIVEWFWVGLSLCVAFYSGGLFSITVAVAALFWSARAGRTEAFAQQTQARGNDASTFRTHRVWLGILLLAVGVLALAVTRPPSPRYWDEWIWLAKARFSSAGHTHGGTSAWLFGVDRLTITTLARESTVIPQGYPPGYPIAVSLLSARGEDLSQLTIGASAFCITSALLFLGQMLSRFGLKCLPALALLLTPYVALHLTTMYVDLPLGLIAASITLLATGENRVGPQARLTSSCLTLLLPLIKDEGFVAAVIAWGVAFSLNQPIRIKVLLETARHRWPWFGVLTPAVFFHVANQHAGGSSDHNIEGLVLSRVPQVLYAMLVSVVDLATWGVFWALIVGVGLTKPFASGHSSDASAADPRTPMKKTKSDWQWGSWPLAAHTKVALWVTTWIGIFIASVASGTEQIYAFATNGTLINRFVLSVVPMCLVMAALFVQNTFGRTRLVSNTRATMAADKRT